MEMTLTNCTIPDGSVLPEILGGVIERRLFHTQK